MTRTPPRSRATARLAASLFGALLVWLLAGAHVASSLHFALVSHRVCAAHGEVEHADSEHAGTAGAHRNDAEPGYREGGEDLEHHQCNLLGAPREKLAVAAPERLSVAPAARLRGAAVPDASAPAPARAELLLVAPKQSPPV